MTFSYAISKRLTTSLECIDELRKEILLTVTPVPIESMLRFETRCNQIHALMHLGGVAITKKDIVQILMKAQKTSSTKTSEEVWRLKNMFDDIRESWLMDQKMLTVNDLSLLYEQVTGSKANLSPTQEQTLKQTLNYIQTGKEHPIVGGAVGYAMVITSPFAKNRLQLASLTSYLLLYKNGYNVKDFLCIEDYFLKNIPAWKQTSTLRRDQNLTLWLEFYAQSVQHQLQAVIPRLTQEMLHRTHDVPVSDRQRKILQLFDVPGIKITNKKAQKAFKISQITASRDLSHLHAVGLLFKHGRGRAIFYTLSF